MGQGITMPGWRRRTVACPDSEEQSTRDSGQEQKQVGHEYAAGTAYERRFPRVLVRLMKSTFDQDEPGGASPADTEMAKMIRATGERMAWMFTRIDFSMTASSGRKPVRPGSLAGGLIPALQLANKFVG